MFQRGSFRLHKWHFYEQALEINDSANENELNFAKQQLGTKPKEAKMLGLIRDKREDSFNIQIPNVKKKCSKAKYT